VRGTDNLSEHGDTGENIKKKLERRVCDNIDCMFLNYNNFQAACSFKAVIETCTTQKIDQLLNL
jgi:hypothetical protein